MLCNLTWCSFPECPCTFCFPYLLEAICNPIVGLLALASLDLQPRLDDISWSEESSSRDAWRRGGGRERTEVKREEERDREGRRGVRVIWSGKVKEEGLRSRCAWWCINRVTYYMSTSSDVQWSPAMNPAQNSFHVPMFPSLSVKADLRWA